MKKITKIIHSGYMPQYVLHQCMYYKFYKMHITDNSLALSDANVIMNEYFLHCMNTYEDVYCTYCGDLAIDKEELHGLFSLFSMGGSICVMDYFDANYIIEIMDDYWPAIVYNKNIK